MSCSVFLMCCGNLVKFGLKVLVSCWVVCWNLVLLSICFMVVVMFLVLSCLVYRRMLVLVCLRVFMFKCWFMLLGSLIIGILVVNVCCVVGLLLLQSIMVECVVVVLFGRQFVMKVLVGMFFRWFWLVVVVIIVMGKLVQGV